ncbi:hypothetical protein RAZWK3B_12462 [Roseobacter sp. AzwK-3b]|nr:hypothetical protein RAZWK3B_12462 [Roseobacter sp. AzwK-3b]
MQNLDHQQGKLFRIDADQLSPSNQDKAFCVRFTKSGALSEM